MRSVTGAWRDLVGGTVLAEVWNAIGKGPSQLRVNDGQAFVRLPFRDLRSP